VFWKSDDFRRKKKQKIEVEDYLEFLQSGASPESSTLSLSSFENVSSPKWI